MYADDRSTPQLRSSRHQSMQVGERIEQHGTNRRCQAHGCETRLSRYNPSSTCATHAGWADTRRRSYG